MRIETYFFLYNIHLLSLRIQIIAYIVNYQYTYNKSLRIYTILAILNFL